MTFQLTILGCGAALPTMKHFPSSQVLNVRDKLLMFDCGEGAQLQFRKARLKFSRLNHIFISHLHGDHCFGLPGLVSTLSLLGRTADLHLYSPAGLSDMMTPLLGTPTNAPGYRVCFHEFPTDRPSLLLDDRSMTVSTIPLNHRTPCCGFVVREKPTLRHIVREMTDLYHVPTYEMNRLRGGADFVTPDGQVIPNELLTSPSTPPRSYAYLSDTTYMPESVPLIQGVDLLYHEATFATSALHLAQATFHSTATQAAQMATQAGAGTLLIGHFSSRYDDETLLLAEAQAVFPNTLLAHEGQVVNVQPRKPQ